MQPELWWLKLFVPILLLVASCDQTGKSSTAEPVSEAAPEFKPPAQVEAPSLKFELTLTLNDPTDLQVKEGDRITKGQVLADRQPLVD